MEEEDKLAKTEGDQRTAGVNETPERENKSRAAGGQGRTFATAIGEETC